MFSITQLSLHPALELHGGITLVDSPAMHRSSPLALLSFMRLMRVLVAISILAFAALLWASIAIFRHIQRTRRRRRRALEAARNNLYLYPAVPVAIVVPPPPPPVVPEITFTDPEAPLPEITYTDPEPPVRELTPPAVQPYLRQAEPRQVEVRPTDSRPQPEPEATAEEFLDTLPPPTPPAPRDSSFSPIPAWPHFGFTPSRPAQPLRSPITIPAEPELALAAVQALEDQQVSGRMPTSPPEPIPYAAPVESSASATPARLPMLIHPPPPAVKPVYPSPYPLQQGSQQPQAAEEPLPSPQPPVPLRPAHQPISRADWAYFNKDMGDLSDPAPAGSRSRIPAFVPQTPIKPKSN